MRYRDITREMRELLPVKNGIEHPVLVNPTRAEALAIDGNKRFVIDGDDNLYVWKSYELTHHQVIAFFGLTGTICGHINDITDFKSVPVAGGGFARKNLSTILKRYVVSIERHLDPTVRSRLTKLSRIFGGFTLEDDEVI